MPPIWLMGFAALAYWQARILPAGLSLAHPITMFLAGVLMGGGVILVGLAVVEFRRHATTIMPHQTPSQLIQSGIFKRSRNPIYLADVLILTGLILYWDAILSLVLVPILFWVLENRFVIPEETRLRRQFRADFARYEQQTRRWL